MAGETLAVFSLLLYLFLLAMPNGSHGGDIATYWGQDDFEGSLADACRTNYYQIVNIAFLSQFGGGTTMQLNLGSHCLDGICPSLSNDIKLCQSMGVKVLLSIGGPGKKYSLSSADEASTIAGDIWNQFLGGKTDVPRPFGDAVLDGVDFYIANGNTQFWGDLVKALNFSSGTKKSYFSAAPQCSFPDPRLDSALKTFKFDYVWIRFYNNNPCEYTGNADNLRRSWAQWSKSISASKLYLGLPASQEAADSGYIEARKLINDVLPSIKSSSNYGGIMLWSRYYDHGYSSEMKPYV